MNRFGKILLLLLFLMFIFGIGTLKLVREDRQISFWENRSLAQKPSLTLESVADGSYMEGFDDYFTDQFPFRDRWILAHIFMEKFTNQTYIKDFYITDDHFILKNGIRYFAKDNINKFIEQLNYLGEITDQLGSELYFFYLPSRIISLKDLFPEFMITEYTAYSKDFYLMESRMNLSINSIYQMSGKTIL